MIGQQAVGEPAFLPQHITSRSSAPLLGSQGIISRRWIEENRTKLHAPSVHRFHGRNEEALLDIAQPAFVFSSGNWRFCLDDRDDGPDDDYLMYTIFEATTFDAM